QEKVVAMASDQMIVIADASKRVDTLGKFPLPIEVLQFGSDATQKLIANLLVAQGAFDPSIFRQILWACGVAFGRGDWPWR
ncbi:MAG: hypothetical protein EBU10_09095, partial [Alphaproteobacteria bacterium]|nr:hypothetical protein [Alphaproteobacteria bacterium]